MKEIKHNLLTIKVICPKCKKVEYFYTPLDVEKNVPCWKCQKEEK